MQLSDIDYYYEQKEEPVKSCMLAVRNWILNSNHGFTEAWKYRMPCFCYNGKAFCYLWTDKKIKLPYILFVDGRKIEHPLLVQGDRKRMKIMYLDPNQDLPTASLTEIFEKLIQEQF